VNLGENRELFLARTARRIETAAGRRISRIEVIRLLIDAAMQDEAALGAQDPSSPRTPGSTRLRQPEQRAPTTSGLELSALLRILEPASHPSDGS